MKSLARFLLASLFAFAATAALPFSDGFEAHASTCWSGVTAVDAANDTQAPVLVQPGSLVCLDASVAKFNCVRDALGLCQRQATAPPTQPPTTGIPACTFPGIAGQPNVQPPGMRGVPKTWPDLMLGAPFPKGNAYLSPVGSYTLRSLSPSTQGPPMTGKYIAVEIIPQAASNYVLSWTNVQRQVAVPGYTTARHAATVFVSLSPCAGDLRAGTVFTTDPWLKMCRASSSGGSFKFGTTGAQGQCKLQPNQRYYLNIAFVEPADGLSPTETTCTYKPSEGRCEVNMQGM